MMTIDELISEIKEQINSGNRGASDYLIVDEIERLIEEYEKSGGCEKCNDHSEPECKTGRWEDKHAQLGTCSACGFRTYLWNYCPNCGSYNGGMK